MDVVALHTVLRSGRGDDYERLHQEIPADVAAALREHGVHDWRIWRDGRDVLHLIEVEDYAAMREALRDLPANRSWQATVGPLFDVPDDYVGADPQMIPLWSLSRQLAQ